MSLIISIFSFAQIIFSPLGSTIKNWFGAKNTIVMGFMVASCTIFGIGAVGGVEDAWKFKCCAVAIRFLMGMGDVMVQITCYNVLLNTFSNKTTIIVQYIELSCGLGIAIGPIIGSTVYSTLDYKYTMYLFAFFNLITIIICLFTLPNTLNHT